VLLEGCTVVRVARAIIPKFLSPIDSIGLWFRGELARMSVPKTAVHKNDLAVSGENDVWSAWKVRVVKSKSVAERVQN
jgi:hypothetical protein